MEPLTVLERVEALTIIAQMMAVGDAFASKGDHARAIEVYRDCQDMLAVYRERVV